MEAKIVYMIEHRNFGDGHEDTGWYIVEMTLMAGGIINRKPVARFIGDSVTDAISNMMSFDEYSKAGHHVAHRDLRGMDGLLRL
jgi:hypothetical protein